MQPSKMGMAKENFDPQNLFLRKFAKIRFAKILSLINLLYCSSLNMIITHNRDFKLGLSYICVSVLRTLHVFLHSSTIVRKHFLLTPCRKYPELFGSFKTLLGFKDPGLPEQLPTNASLPPYPPKERVTEFAAEIGEGFWGLE